MDPKLAEIYGTNNPSQSDVEKLAAAELAESLAGNEDANIDGMSDEQVEALAAQVLAQQSEAAPADGEDDAQEKVAEADYLGRVMAHAYVQELRNMEKVAEESAPAPEAPKSKMQRVKEFAGKHKKKLIAGGLMTAGAVAAKKGYNHFKGRAAAAAEKTVQSSALDTLAEQRALAILEANGIDLNEIEKQSGAEDVLEQAVDGRAWEMLAELGFTQK